MVGIRKIGINTKVFGAGGGESGLDAYKSDMVYWGGNMDFETNQWTDKSGSGNGYGDLKGSSCMRFGGTNTAFIDTNVMLSEIKSAAPITMMMRFMTTDNSALQGIFDERTSGNGFIIYDGEVRGRYETEGGQDILVANISNDTWYTVGLTHDGTDIKLYLDGVQSGETVTAKGSTIVSGNDFYFGYAGRRILGDVCDVRIYGDAKTPAEMLAYHNGLYDETNLLYAIPFSENELNAPSESWNVYEIVNGQRLGVSGDTDASWVTQDVFHYNIQQGFQLMTNDMAEGHSLKIPYYNGSPVTHGTSMVVHSQHPAQTSGHNGAETLIDINGTTYDYDDLRFDDLHIRFCNVLTEKNYTDFIQFSAARNSDFATIRTLVGYDTLFTDVYGEGNLSTFIAAIEGWVSGLLKTVHIGDSLTPCAFWGVDRMKVKYSGFGGGGIIPFSNNVYDSVENSSPGMIDWSYSAEWTFKDSDDAASAEERGLEVSSIVTSNAAATVNIDLNYNKATSIKVWYYQDTDHGSFDYSIDGGGAVTVDTSGVAGLQSATIGSLSDASHEIDIDNITDGDVRLYGISFEKAAGMINNFIGNGGSTTDEWDETSLLGDYLTAESPDLVTIGLGANDTALKSAATFKSELKTIIDLIQANCSAEIMIHTPNDRNPVGGSGYAAKIESFSEVMKELATEESVLFFDLNNNWYTYAEASAASLMSDDIHPNDAGWLDQGNLYWKMILNS